MTQSIKKEITIKAPPAAVWNTLVDPALMRQWMGEPEMEIEVITGWTVGNPIVIKGFHHVTFENRGTVRQFVPQHLLKYDYLSSISRLPDRPENYTVVEFKLAPASDHTLLTLTLSNFPTESIFRHVNFYWTGTVELIRRMAEELPEKFGKLVRPAGDF